MLIKDKELEQGLKTLGGDLKDLYDWTKEDIAKLQKQIDAINVTLSQKQEIPMPQPDMELRMEFEELKNLTMKLVTVISKLANVQQPKVVEKKPEEELAEIISQVKPKEEIKAMCLGCVKEMPMTKIEPKPIIDKTGEYLVGFCQTCGRKLFKKVK